MPRRPVSAVTARAVSTVAALALVAALPACGGADRTDPSTAPAPSSSTVASDAGGATTAAPSASPIPVLPPEQEVAVSDPCTGEGAYTLPIGGAIDPALPERGGSTLTLTATGVSQDDGGAAGHLEASIDSDAPVPVAPAHIGERFTVDMWTFSITSICPNQVELDLID